MKSRRPTPRAPPRPWGGVPAPPSRRPPSSVSGGSGWALAGLAAGLAATAHTMGVIAFGVGGLCLLLDLFGGATGTRVPWRTTLTRVVASAAPALACYPLMRRWYQRTRGPKAELGP